MTLLTHRTQVIIGFSLQVKVSNKTTEIQLHFWGNVGTMLCDTGNEQDIIMQTSG